MVVNLYSKALETPQFLSQPLVKANQLFTANLEEIVAFQINAFKAYLDISLNQMKAAAEINDIKSLQDFYKRQVDIAQMMQQKFMHDARIMSGMFTRFKAEMDHLAQATLEDTLPKAA